MRHLGEAPGRRRTFGLRSADYRLEARAGDEWLVGPSGPIAPRRAMARDLPHDVTNSLAAAALVLETGLADGAAIEQVLGRFEGPPHRLAKIGEWNDVAWYDDSKATTPHAAATAIAGFERVVLIAGGYDKRVDLSPMAVAQDRLRALVANGATGPALAALFDRVEQNVVVETLADAVRTAHQIAQPGDTVLLSPGCASFDQFSGFGARGDAFIELARDVHRRDLAPGGCS
jgi:UDP-N-acetylmuramoylalanine--D-glutamate ligase